MSLCGTEVTSDSHGGTLDMDRIGRDAMDSNQTARPDATVDDLAEHFGVSSKTVRRWIKHTDIPYRRVGSLIRFNIGEVDEWAKARAA